MFLDIAVGIFLAAGVSWVFAEPLTWQIIAATALLALFPDIDFWVEFLRHGSVGGKAIREHRELLHYPLSYIPPLAVVFYFAGAFWGTLAILALVWHFLHDSVGAGWGIRWFWPFSKRPYKFFSEKDGAFSSRFIVSWNDAELRQIVAEHGDPNWMRNIYLRPSPTLIIELAVLFTAFAFLFLYQ